MMRALFSGVTGLRSHQTRLDVIGNNISNVNTVGYKKAVANFSDLFSETQSSAAGPTGTLGGTNAKQIGLGAQMSTIQTLHTTGTTQYTGNPLDIAIEGDGYLILRSPDGERYTRAGNLQLDTNGYLLNATSNFVQGYGSNWKFGTEGKATGSSKLSSLNYDVKNHVFKPSVDGDGNPTDGLVAATSGSYKFVLRDLTTNPTDPPFSGGYAVDVYRDGMLVSTGADGDGPGEVTATVFTATRDAATGEFTLAGAAWNGADVAADDPATAGVEEGFMCVQLKDSTNKVIFEYYVQNTGTTPISYDETTTAGQASWKDLDSMLSTMTTRVQNNDGFESTANMGDLFIDSQIYYDTSIDSSGAVIAQLREQSGGVNGSPVLAAGTKVVIGYIALATFTNANGLEKVGDSIFVETANSGAPQYGMSGEPGFGSIKPSTLEMSNVDLADEMVNMIVTQRGLQANTRIITTSDSVLEELVNLKR